MAFNEYKIIIAPKAIREMSRIYEYISEELFAEDAAKKLIKEVNEKIQILKYTPKIHSEIEKFDDLKRKYRKIVIKNYVILYTIDYQKGTVYILHMYYIGKNYQ